MLKIKVCGMCDPLNVIEVSKTEPDFIGFIFYKGSPRYVGAQPDRSLFRNVAKGIIRAGVFVNEDIPRVLERSLMAGLELIQLHGNESPEYCSRLRSSGLITVKAFSISENFDFEKLRTYLSYCDYFLFDTKSQRYGGSGMKFNWDLLENYGLEKPFFLSGGVGPRDAERIGTLHTRGFFAVDVNSQFETMPGLKDPNLLKPFIDKIKTPEHEI